MKLWAAPVIGAASGSAFGGMGQSGKDSALYADGVRQNITYDEGQGAGWALFAGSMIILGGFLNVIDGLVGIFQASYFKEISDTHSVHLPAVSQIHAWGWTALIIGLGMVVVGFFVYTRVAWARITGIVIAGLNMLFQLAFMAAFPWWSLTMILVDVAVIYALAVSYRPKNY